MSPTRTWSSRIRKKPEMTSRTRFCAPKPIARPAIPAPVRIGSTSIASSRSTIRTATNQTVTVTRLVRIPPSVLARRCHSRSAWVCRCERRCCRLSIARFAARITMAAPTRMMTRLTPCVSVQWPMARRSHVGSARPKRASANETLPMAATPNASRRSESDQPGRPLVQGLAVLRRAHLHRAERAMNDRVRHGHDDGRDGKGRDDGRMVSAYSGIRAAESSGSWRRFARDPG